ncbi:hypothetical protein CYMTET_56098 [Cymbomonas tetramitiformis]|uniref:Uncharacterized protein n=1 Tax=Cymbomonas tetramitiformis TaxID=36881 RepID=A0AAE0EP34_9CHLO|nr:hypothetical protein CYMTET_56098 [Cymbomonas tetramitiformis]
MSDDGSEDEEQPEFLERRPPLIKSDVLATDAVFEHSKLGYVIGEAHVGESFLIRGNEADDDDAEWIAVLTAITVRARGGKIVGKDVTLKIYETVRSLRERLGQDTFNQLLKRTSRTGVISCSEKYEIFLSDTIQTRPISVIKAKVVVFPKIRFYSIFKPDSTDPRVLREPGENVYFCGRSVILDKKACRGTPKVDAKISNIGVNTALKDTVFTRASTDSRLVEKFELRLHELSPVMQK